MSDNSGLWPALPYEQLAPTVDHLNRLVQIAGKYTLDQLFELAGETSSMTYHLAGCGLPPFESGG